MSETVTMRLATPDDQAILDHWYTLPHIIETSGSDGGMDWGYELPRDVDWREIFITELDGKPIGVFVIIDAEKEETHYWGDTGPGVMAIDIWIGAKECIGKGYGFQMMSFALDRCFADPAVHTVLIDPLVSNKPAIGFYEKMGYRFVEERFFDDDHCHVMRYSRKDWLSKKADWA